MPDRGDQSAEELPAPAPSGISPEEVRSFRSQLTKGGRRRSDDVGRVDPPSAGHRSPRAHRSQQVVQPALAATDRVPWLDRRRGERFGGESVVPDGEQRGRKASHSM